jgi:hypothetical protein
MPESLQDSLLHLVSTSALGYSMVWFVKLYRLSPLYVIIPFVAVAIITHFYVYSNTQSSKLKRKEIFPLIEKSVNDQSPATDATGTQQEQRTPVTFQNSQRAITQSSIPAESLLASRKASMAHGEVIGLQMVHQLRQQHALTLTEEGNQPDSSLSMDISDEDDDDLSGSDVSSSDSSLSDYEMTIRIVETSSQQPLDQNLSSIHPPLIDTNNAGIGIGEEVEWSPSSDDSEEKELSSEDEEYWSVGT